MYDLFNGIRVLEVSSWVFLPSAGALLADWGAEVIKIEHPDGGDPQRGLFNQMVAGPGPNPMIEAPNRGKRSVGLDIGTPGGLELLLRLAKTCDVFVTSFLPEARKRLGIDVADIRAANPDIIYVRGTGQGIRGPDAEKGGYDLASHWYRSGFCERLTPEGSEEPIFQPGSVGDFTSGLAAAGGIAAALFRRERDGTPSVVDVSLLATGIWMLGPAIIAAKQFGRALPLPTRKTPVNPITNSYRTRDGRWLCLVLLQPDRYWADLCRHLDRPDLIEDPRFKDSSALAENRDAAVRLLDEIFASRTLAEWRKALDTLEGVWAPAQSPGEVAEDPQTLANGYLPDVRHGDQTFQIAAGPIQFDETPVGELNPAPELGQHTEEVLLELGLSWDELSAYKDQAAIL